MIKHVNFRHWETCIRNYELIESTAGAQNLCVFTLHEDLKKCTEILRKIGIKPSLKIFIFM